MAECQSRRMKCLAGRRPLKELGDPAGSPGDPATASAGVDWITHDRVPLMLKVHPDLMGPAGVQLQPEQVYHTKPRDYRGVRPGLAALRGNTHSFAVALASCNWRVDPDRIGVEMTPDQGGVAPLHPAGSDGGAEPAVSQVGLGDDHETGRIAVETMDDSRPPLRASGQGGAAGNQRVDQGVVPMARRRVDHQAGGLVDDGEVLVFEDEREWDGSGLERSRRFVVRNPDDDDLTAGKEAGSASDFSVDRHPLVGH